MKLILEFLQKPMRIKWMLIVALCYSLHYKHLIGRTPFAKYAETIGTFQYETPEEPIADTYIDDVRWVTYAIERWAPWKSLCFDRALLAKRFLNRHGLPCTLYMGVKRNEKGELTAHAWLRCGVVCVTGGKRRKEYAVTGIWGDKAEE